MLPRLQAIVDADVARAAGWTPVDLARAYLDGGARFLQIRAKAAPSGALLDLCDRVVALGREAGALVIVNDRVDLARLSGASGVHVGQEDIAVADAWSLLGPEAVIGTSTHNLAQVREALAQPVTYVASGPVFGTRTKDTGYNAVGLTLVSQTAALCHGRPVVAIGGITLERAPSVIAAGAACVAVISDLLERGDPAERVKTFCRALE